MNKKKSILVLLASILAIFSAGIMTGAISFNPMPTLFQEYWQGGIDNTSYTLDYWALEILDPDTIMIYLNGTAQVSADYTFLVSIMDNTGFEVQNATRTISLTSGISSIEMFTLTASEIVAKFTYIDVEITR